MFYVDSYMYFYYAQDKERTDAEDSCIPQKLAATSET